MRRPGCVSASVVCKCGYVSVFIRARVGFYVRGRIDESVWVVFRTILAAHHSHNPATCLLCGIFGNICNQEGARVHPTNSTARQDLIRQITAARCTNFLLLRAVLVFSFDVSSKLAGN